MDDQASSQRERIVEAALGLLSSHGREGVTTRAVAAAAGTQAPVIYRLFGDKEGLLQAVAEHGFRRYLTAKQNRVAKSDAVQNFRGGWDLHVEFGLAHPALFSLMYGEPQAGPEPPALALALGMLRRQVQDLAAAGALGVTQERAVGLIRAAGCGIVFTLLATPPEQRDPGLSTAAREGVLQALSGHHCSGAPSVANPAVTLRALLPDTRALTHTERALMAEWLDRIVAGEVSGQASGSRLEPG